MRVWLAISLVLLGADYPRHRRFAQRNLSSSRLSANWIALDGHSILHGISPLLVPTEVGQLLTRTVPTTLAVGGSRVANCTSRFDAFIKTNIDYSTLVWQCAVNDILDGTDGTTIWNATQVSLDAAIARGKFVVINSELPCGVTPCTTANQITDLLYYNARANAWAIENGAHARYAANYQWFVVTDGGVQLASEDNSGDGLHLIDGGTAPDGGYLGSDKLARLTAAAIDAGPLGPEAGGEVVHVSGIGMGTACANAVITADDGGTITTTRAGTAWCSKQGYARTGIANGDLVLVSANRPRVEPGYDGGMRIRREAAGTNNTSNPLNLAAGSWATQGVNVAAPTVTGSGCTAPDGTATGTRVQFAATTGAADVSVIYNLTGCSTGAGQSQGLYVRNNGAGTAAINMIAYDLAGGHHVVAGTTTSASWTQLVQENFIESDVASGYFMIGNGNLYTGSSTPMAATDLCLWGAQCETNETLTSLMNTTRGAETDTAGFTATGPFVSFAATVDTPSALKAGRTWLQAYFDANNDSKGYTSATINTCDFRQGGTSHTSNSTATVTTSASNRLVCAYVASVGRSCVNGSCAYPSPATTLTLPTGAGTLYIGGRQAAGNEINALIGDISLSTTSTGSQ